jgi:hypothetical protein
VTHVRTILAQVDAYEQGSFDLVVAHAGDAPIGGDVVFTASIDSAELSPVSGEGAPYDVGTCPASIAVTKFFDTDGDGVRDAGEPGIAAWAIEVRDAESNLVDSGVTDQDGAIAFEVPLGDYTVTEVLPEDADVTWLVTTPGGLSRAVTAGMTDPVQIAFGNRCTCDDDDACTTDTCVAPGVCASTPVDLACDAPDACSVSPGACDPATGQCAYDPVACDAVPIYAVVEDADGQAVGTVQCFLFAGETLECDATDGVLNVSDVLWCQSGEAK